MNYGFEKEPSYILFLYLYAFMIADYERKYKGKVFGFEIYPILYVKREIVR